MYETNFFIHKLFAETIWNNMQMLQNPNPNYNYIWFIYLFYEKVVGNSIKRVRALDEGMGGHLGHVLPRN